MRERHLIAYAVTVLLVILVPWTFRRLLIIGGSAETVGEYTYYPTRLGMRLLLYVFSFVGVCSVVAGFRHFHEGKPTFGLLYIAIGVVCQVGLAFANAKIVVDHTKLQYQAPLVAATVINWDDLSHFERFYNGRAVTCTIYFRSKSGVTIGVGDTSFDTEGLLRQITALCPLNEKMYKRKHWYGG